MEDDYILSYITGSHAPSLSTFFSYKYHLALLSSNATGSCVCHKEI
jgi:hypothetical protein